MSAVLIAAFSERLKATMQINIFENSALWK